MLTNAVLITVAIANVVLANAFLPIVILTNDVMYLLMLDLLINIGLTNIG
jgi:hypothetical protein